MKIAFELLALFRQKAGSGRLVLEVPAGDARGAAFGTAPCKVTVRGAGAGRPSVLDALRAAEAGLGGQGLLQGERLREGVLVFLRDSSGGTRRVLLPAAERVQPGQTVVLSTAMGGG